jgi:signal transduction histidine kinase
MSATRGRSLFWTIAGVLLLAVVLGTLVQWVMAVAVLRPLEEREFLSRAELMAASAASELTEAPTLPSGMTLDEVLARHRGRFGPRPPILIFRASDGTIAPYRFRFLVKVLEDSTGKSSSAEFAPGPPDSERFVPREGGEFPERREPLAPSERFGPGGRPAPPGPARLAIVARRSVLHAGQAVGEILVLRPVRPNRGPWPPEARWSLLFLPIAVVASAVAGLVIVRLLVRRLRAVEMLAARVAEGDLTVRIGDRSGDEIGRIADRLDTMTERVAAAQASLQRVDAQRRQLFADITHELATPLTSIRGYAETLLDPGVPKSDDERARYVGGVLEESRRLDRLIRDLFELARLEAGAAPLSREPIDGAALCANTVERFQPRFRNAGLTLRWMAPPSEAPIDADGHRMEQVLENLLGNALRYVPSGGTVELSLSRVEASPARWRLEASDDGPGLPPEELPRVFQRFYRASGSRAARESGGSGLGLAIVREIVERHGGTVSARTREPHGLVMVVEMPAPT